ncbi:MAG: Amuc_1102 family pilus-like protein [Verrucomicrobiota bacterium]
MTPSVRFPFSGRGRLAAACVAWAFCQAGPLAAQEANAAIAAKIDSVEILEARTPEYEGGTITRRDSGTREWVLIESELEIRSADRENRSPFHPSLQVNFHVALEKNSETGKIAVLSGEVDYVNVRFGETIRVGAFISPNDLELMSGDRDPGKKVVNWYAIEVVSEGTILDMAGEGGPKRLRKEDPESHWWKVDSPLIEKFTVIRARKDTPFAPMWWDYYAEEAGSGGAE